jgi:FKBP-type peptidyl-prolyl cis-trans isomerase
MLVCICKARLTISSCYAYGVPGKVEWGVPGNATVVFEVELVKIDPAPVEVEY